MTNMTMARPRRVYDNDNDSMKPEIWAMYTIAVLESNMVAGNLVYRDFENLLANQGDTVNTRKPGTFTVSRKTDFEDVSTQDANTTNVAVQLNMRPYVSFLIRDGEESMSMQSLVDLHLEPAVKAMAEHIDACILGQYPQFLLNGAGGTLGALSASNYQAYLTEVVEGLDVSKCPVDQRNIVVGPSTKRLILQNQPLVGADQRGDAGTALRAGSLGMIYGVDHFMCQNMKEVSATDTTTGFLVNLTAGYQKGDTALVVDTGTGSIADNQWIAIGGKPYRIVSAADTLGNTTSIVITPGLRTVVANNDPITVYDTAAVNNGAGYAAGYQKTIAYDGATILLKAGQFISFGTANPGTSAVYTIVDATSTTILLDRPLEAALVDNDPINAGPPGKFGLAFRRDAIALVCRPLKLPRQGAGALAANVNHNGFSLRVVIAYNAVKQGHMVTIDCLLGIKVLDTAYGAVLLG